ncbi:MAG: hypothetical protein ACK4GM_16320, partial [Tabrizicola sp.]
MRAAAGSDLTVLPQHWPHALRSLVSGGEPAGAADRAAYLVAVLGPDGLPAGEEGLALAVLVLQGFGHLPAEVMVRRLPGLRVEAASRVRAAAAAGRGLREGPGEVEAGSVVPSHAGFFAVNVHRLRHR